jgi:hypothetical protein
MWINFVYQDRWHYGACACKLNTSGYIYILTICNTYCFSITTMVAGTYYVVCTLLLLFSLTIPRVPFQCHSKSFEGATKLSRANNSLIQNIHTGSGLTEPPIQRVQNSLSPRVKRPWREADHSTYLARRLKVSGAVPLLPHMPSWSAQGQLTSSSDHKLHYNFPLNIYY